MEDDVRSARKRGVEEALRVLDAKRKGNDLSSSQNMEALVAAASTSLGQTRASPVFSSSSTLQQQAAFWEEIIAQLGRELAERRKGSVAEPTADEWYDEQVKMHMTRKNGESDWANQLYDTAGRRIDEAKAKKDVESESFWNSVKARVASDLPEVMSRGKERIEDWMKNNTYNTEDELESILKRRATPFERLAFVLEKNPIIATALATSVVVLTIYYFKKLQK